jgi:hypothetical protein
LRFLEYIVTLFVNTLVLTSRIIRFGIVITLDEKTYSLARKASGRAGREGFSMLSCFFYSIGHWHAVKNAMNALLLKGPGWPLLVLLRKKNGCAKLSFTADSFSREMTFAVAQSYLGIMRAGWLRHRLKLRKKAADNPQLLDLQMLVVYHDFLIPVTLDFLKIIKHGQAAGYLYILPRFMMVLAITHSTLYFKAFLFFYNDLLHIKEKLPRFYNLIINNLHRTVVEVPIEYQHKVLAAHSEHISRRGYLGVDAVLMEWTRWAKASAFVRTYGRIFSRANDPGAYRLVDAEAEERNAFIILEYGKVLEDLFTKISGGHRTVAHLTPSSSAKGDQVESPILGTYSAAYLGGERWLGNYY